jgi:predicted RNA-binding Zn-ribbon protein involved in translation (DUF1610 family)
VDPSSPPTPFDAVWVWQRRSRYRNFEVGLDAYAGLRTETDGMSEGTGTTGYVMMMVGAVMVGAGIAISFTGIGACLGIPMVLIGLPLLIIGAIMRSRARSKRVDAVVSQAVSESVARAMTQPSQPQLVPSSGPTCNRCGASAAINTSFCPQCGNALVVRATGAGDNSQP